jgi:mannose-6-phosphate isomerase-like protein (cupin superfamily)
MADRDETAAAEFRIFRAKDAPSLMESGCMTVEPYTPVQREGMDKVLAAGFLEGDEVRVLVDLPGFSLTHVWFKPGYPLPLHSHDADCLYYVIAGSIRLGTEDLGPRDSFFVPANVPYAYRPGPEGVELLEFRQQGKFNFVNLAKGAEFWDKAAAQVTAHREGWKTAEPPRLN